MRILFEFSYITPDGTVILEQHYLPNTAAEMQRDADSIAEAKRVVEQVLARQRSRD